MSNDVGDGIGSSRAPRVMIAAVRSGSGKTSIATGLMGALAGRGYRVQGFKVGPDFIDPSFHTAVTGRWSRNLDTWMLSCGQVREFFRKDAADADIAVIEGVMGLFDGLAGAGEWASSAQVAKLLGCPVVLVLDVRGQARSAVVEWLGCRSFDPDLRLAGVILNRYTGERHLEILRAGFREAGIPVLGAVRDGSLPRLTERHLGLVPVPEQQDADPMSGALWARLSQDVARQVDMDAILDVAESAPYRYRTYRGRERLAAICGRGASAPECAGNEGFGEPEQQYCIADRTGQQRPAVNLKKPVDRQYNLGKQQRHVRDEVALRQDRGSGEPVRVALAWDAAFNFYYRDGLDLLAGHGIELISFSPLRDQSLPPKIAGVLVGGGFPELFAQQLAGNEGMKDSLRRAHTAGLPIYAECGGFMYLCESLGDLEGRDYPMVGLVPGRCRMAERLVGMGYVTVEAQKPNILCQTGETLRGHEFHYSSFIPSRDVFPWAFTFRKRDGRNGSDGYADGSLLASYFHFHFAANPRAAARFAAYCRNWISGNRTVIS
jgi:cobyrinic acid a,c-diamide synthase